jgi:hypothetical protein
VRLLLRETDFSKRKETIGGIRMDYVFYTGTRGRPTVKHFESDDEANEFFLENNSKFKAVVKK